MIIRPVKIAELEELSALCLRSKAHWPYDPAFIEACRAELTLRAEDLNQAVVRVAEIDGIAVGVLKLALAPKRVELDLLFIEPDYLGQGIGKLLLNWGIDHARAAGALKMTTVADPYASDFYAHMGFKRTGEAPSGSIPGRELPEMTLQL